MGGFSCCSCSSSMKLFCGLGNLSSDGMWNNLCLYRDLSAEHGRCDVLTCQRWILLIIRGFKQMAGDVAHVTQ